MTGNNISGRNSYLRDKYLAPRKELVDAFKASENYDNVIREILGQYKNDLQAIVDDAVGLARAIEMNEFEGENIIAEANREIVMLLCAVVDCENENELMPTRDEPEI